MYVSVCLSLSVYLFHHPNSGTSNSDDTKFDKGDEQHAMISSFSVKID